MPSADISEVAYTGDTVSTKKHLPVENRPFVIVAMQSYEDSFQKKLAS